jgi:hypothetical protein
MNAFDCHDSNGHAVCNNKHACVFARCESNSIFVSFSNLFSLSISVFPFGPALLILLSPDDSSSIVLSSSISQITGNTCLPRELPASILTSARTGHDTVQSAEPYLQRSLPSL